jgi:hypothetical protein
MILMKVIIGLLEVVFHNGRVDNLEIDLRCYFQLFL